MLKKTQLRVDTILFDRKKQRVGILKNIDLATRTSTLIWSDGTILQFSESMLNQKEIKRLKAIRIRDFPLAIPYKEEVLFAKPRKSECLVDRDQGCISILLDIIASHELTEDYIRQNIFDFLPKASFEDLDSQSLLNEVKKSFSLESIDRIFIQLKLDPTNKTIYKLKIEILIPSEVLITPS